MNSIKKNIKNIYFYLFIFFIVSTITIYSTLSYLPKSTNNILLKQILFYILGFIIIFILQKLRKEGILKYSIYIYLISILLLLIALIFGKEINGIKAWINIPLIGRIQPSEFMKIGLILFLAKIIKSNKEKQKKEIIIILKSIIIFLIPTILVFLEPDTGSVIIYFIITITMLYSSKIDKKWFLFLFIFILVFGIIFSYLYFFKSNIFVQIFGTNFFYRFDRILNFINTSGLQLENSIIGIATSSIFGKGINSIPIYFPELQTDFIFSSYTSCYGIFGAIILIMFIFLFDNQLINIAKLSKNEEHKLIIIGTTSALIYQQIQNISMTIGLMPIIGITLPFISYGGSSLISYMIMIGTIINIIKKE